MNNYRILLFGLFFLANTLSVFAQKVPKKPEWQLISKSGKVIVPPAEYIELTEFAEGLCAVKNVREKWGYINNEGLTIVPFMYDDVQAFQEGVAVVGIKNKQDMQFGIIDYKGREVLPVKYDKVFQVNQDLYAFGNKKMGLIHRTGVVIAKTEFSEILPNSYGNGLIPVCKGDVWGYLGEEGEMGLDYSYHQVSPFVNGNALVLKSPKSTSLILIDQTGKELLKIPYQNDKNNFKSAKLRQDGLIELLNCAAFDATGNCSKQLVGLMNSTGKEICQTEFDEIPAFKNGLSIAKKGGWLGLLKADGKSLTSYQFQFVFPYLTGQALARKEGNLLVKIDKLGNELDVLGPYLLGEMSENLIAAAKCKICYSDKEDFKWGYLNLTGEFVIPMQFTQAKPFHEGLAAVQNAEGLWGFIDAEGGLALPYQFEEVKNFNNQVAWVVKPKAK